jgi:phage terminase Nu1 subunit (DNA packaging protein)
MPRGGARPGAGRPPRESTTEFLHWKAEKEKHLCKLRELEAQQKAGELEHVNVSRDKLISVVNQMNAHLDTIPIKLKRESPDLTARHLEIVETVISKVRAAMARIEP